MTSGKSRICELIDEKKDSYARASDQIWNFAETRFNLTRSADVLCDMLNDAGFQVQRGICGMDDAIVATWGNGKPIIGILGEYDALPNLNQEADLPQKSSSEAGAPGHGCGHNLLGVGALAGAVAIRQYMEERGIQGTVKFFGCPAEEGGSGKAFMARGGAFDGLDGILTWHPMTEINIWGSSSLANYQVSFKFKGVSSHAAAAPEHGRSALDAAELMNVGVNYLREHVVQEARIHYAYLDAGGEAPNVVQPTAKLLYFVRAPISSQVKEIYERVVNIAKGAALMTGTEMEIEWDSACAEYIVNAPLARAMQDNAEQLGPLQFTEQEQSFARQYVDQLPEQSRLNFQTKLRHVFSDQGGEKLQSILKQPILEEIMPLKLSGAPMAGSTDVGDASWQAPTVQMTAPCYPIGTVPHSWEWVSCGKSSMAHKGMLYAGKVIAMTALDMFTNAELMEQAHADYDERLAGETYFCPIPKDIEPK